MVLAPPYIEVDGLVVPLQVYSPENGRDAGIGHAEQSRTSKLAPLRYVIGELLSRRPADVLDLLAERKKLPLPDGLVASPVTAYFDDFADSALNWQRLAGYPPDLSDVYFIATTFLSEDLVIPRLTFIKLMERLYELDAAVREGRIEPAIDESISMPPPRPEPTEPSGAQG